MKDLSGQKFGRLTAIEPADRNEKSRTFVWRCICDCGKEHFAETDALTTGNVSSCGCLRLEKLREKIKECDKWVFKKHGMYRTRLYRIWRLMLNRCERTNENVKARYYKSKGIKVCDAWHEFVPFMSWAFSSGYEDGLTIDRIDNSQGYNPKNCRWVTPKQQARNRTNNVTYQGKCLAEWAEEIGMHYQTLRKRLEAGWSWEKALSEPVRSL